MKFRSCFASSIRPKYNDLSSIDLKHIFNKKGNSNGIELNQPSDVFDLYLHHFNYLQNIYSVSNPLLFLLRL